MMEEKKYRKFSVVFYKGFKKVGASSMISGSSEGLTLEEAKEYCRDRFPGRTVKIKV